MKLVTFQSYAALEFLIKNKFLICDDTLVNQKKVGKTYNWVVEKMNKQIPNNTSAKYPIWAWVKCYNGVCPPKRKGTPVSGFDVKITFNKKNKDVFITDFRLYSFLLNNMYIPESKKDKDNFDELLKKYNITSDELKAFVRSDKYKSHRNDQGFIDICNKIRASFDKCITTNSDVLQGCVWQIALEEVESIEILHDKNYSYGTLNYIRSNGERINWIEDYYKRLK